MSGQENAATELRANTDRARTVDGIFHYLSLNNPGAYVKPEYAAQEAANVLGKINTAIDNEWLADVPRSLGRLIRFSPEASINLSQVIVDTLNNQPAGTPGIGFCAIKSGVGCINTPVTREEEFYMRGINNSASTSAMSTGRVLPINKAAAFINGGALAEARPAEALKRGPLDYNTASALAPLCVTNASGPNTPDADKCSDAGMGYVLARKGYKVSR